MSLHGNHRRHRTANGAGHLLCGTDSQICGCGVPSLTQGLLPYYSPDLTASQPGTPAPTSYAVMHQPDPLPHKPYPLGCNFTGQDFEGTHCFL